MKLDRAQVEHISALARIELTDEEVESFGQQLSHILEQFELLRELDTTDVALTGHAAGLNTVTREDVAQDCLPNRLVGLSAVFSVYSGYTVAKFN